MRFTKMHGLGNNYIYVNEFEESLKEEELPQLARRISNVHTGIGSDGLILIGPSARSDFRMRIFNSDGSEARNCGNGLRCVSKYVYERKLIERMTFTIETLGGIVQVYVHPDVRNQIRSVTVDMGEPRLSKKDIPMEGEAESRTVNEPILIGNETYRMTAVSMGNPHAVMFVPDVETVPIPALGPRIEKAPCFPDRVNVEFVKVISKTEVDFRVWERGSGITQACGTGACAAVVAGVLNGHLERGASVTVHLMGGDLQVVWDHNAHVYMTGAAEFIADGEYFKPKDGEKSEYRGIL